MSITKTTEAIPPFTVILPCDLATGMCIRIDFKCKEKINKNFQVKLEDKQGQNVILFVRYKSGSKKWVFNTKENGKWHTEEIGCSVVTPGEKSEEAWQYSLKQETDLASHINNYRIRQDLELAEYLKIKGDVIVTNICIQTPTETIPVNLPTKESRESMKRSAVSSTGVTIRDDQETETERRRRRLESIAQEMLSAEAIVMAPGGAGSSYIRVKSSKTESRQEQPLNLVRVGDKWVPETKNRGSNTKRRTTEDLGISAVTPVISNEEIHNRSLEIAEEIREKVRAANEKSHKDAHSSRSESTVKFEPLPSKSKAFLGMLSSHMMDTVDKKDDHEKPKYRERRQSSKLANFDNVSSRLNVEDKDRVRTKEQERTYKYFKEPQCWCSIL